MIITASHSKYRGGGGGELEGGRVEGRGRWGIREGEKVKYKKGVEKGFC